MRKLFVFFVLCSFTMQAQNWSGIVAPARAVDWSSPGPGVAGGIPTRSCSVTLGTAGQASTFSQGVSAATVNSALSACTAETAVCLETGTWNMAALTFGSGKANCTLRGQGADKTLIVNNGTDDGCRGSRTIICMASGDTNWKNGNSNLVNWTAGYTKGTSVITLASVPNLKVGYGIMVDQTDTASDNGGFMVSDSSSTITPTNPCSGTTPVNTPPCGTPGPFSLEGNGGGDQRSGRMLQQVVKVTGCGGVTTVGASCSGTGVAVTIYPPLSVDFSGSNSPQAWWATSPAIRLGVENLSVDASAAGTSDSGIELFNCVDCWVRGVRIIQSGRAGVQLEYSANPTVRDSYFFLTKSSVSQSYGVECYGAGNALVENNIMQAIASPEMINGNCDYSVFGYNYSNNNYYTASDNYNASANNIHTAGIQHVLFEGNVGNATYGDLFHGTHHFITHFRNVWGGPQDACYTGPTSSPTPYASSSFGPCTQNTTPVILNSYSRFFNFIFNVLGKQGINTSYPNGIFDIGSGNANQTVTVPSDPNVLATLMRWGNISSADSFAAARFNSSEVPSGLTGSQAAFANPVPSFQTAPASFYLAAKPSWWPTAKPFPAIGPDVTGGNMANKNGHAFTIPAQDCALLVMGMPADGTGPVLSFNADTCYNSGSIPTVIPTVPTGSGFFGQ